MSVYLRARRYTLRMLAVFAATPLWGGALLSLHEALFLLAGALWVSLGAIAFFTFRCPECGTSAYRRGPDWLPIAWPWPNRCCRGCGHDLAAA
jgi:hypothetical protein